MIIREVTFAAENGYIEVTGGSSGIVTPITPAYTTDATETADQTASDQVQDKDNTQTLTASLQKIIAKVKSMNIKLTYEKYNKSKNIYHKV